MGITHTVTVAAIRSADDNNTVLVRKADTIAPLDVILDFFTGTPSVTVTAVELKPLFTTVITGYADTGIDVVDFSVTVQGKEGESNKLPDLYLFFWNTILDS